MRCRTTCLLATVLFLPALAFATIQEPNGVQVPRDSMDGQAQLYTLFQNLSEPIDWQADAHSTPNAFVPMCGLRATQVLYQSTAQLSVGWYNETGTLPGQGDIHPLVPVNTPAGTVISTADIVHDPAYAGGLVGFALIGPQVHYTNPAYNPLCSACNPRAPWNLSLTYSSRLTAHAYYLAFEDGAVGNSPASFNNDGDFTDDVVLIEGLTCSGGDEPCHAGKPGLCASGRTVCTSNGVVCQQIHQPTEEICNGLDDDCNDLVDEGAQCPADQVCDHGQCVPDCATSGCPSGQVCSTQGTCVESACANVPCPVGQVCTAGTCRPACGGVSCPGTQICRVDRCVDPCEGVTCAAGEVCDRGSCRLHCDCHLCSGGTTCNLTSGLCTDAVCASMTCDASTICHQGTCMDPCLNAHCPPGQQCTAGKCVDPTPEPPDAGPADAGSEDAGTPDAGESDAGAIDAGEIDAGVVDAGEIDAGTQDAGDPDAGLVDAGMPDAGAPMPGGKANTSHTDDSSGGCSSPGIVGGWVVALALLLMRSRSRRSSRR